MKAILLHLLFVTLSVVYLAYVDFIQGKAKIEVKEKAIAKGVGIKVFGERGQEWSVQGRELVSVGRGLYLLEVLLVSAEGFKVRADSITLDRLRNVGRLKGNVEIRGEALFVKTQEAQVDFKRGLLKGEGPVQVWKGTNYVEGKGFVAYLKPFRVIISRVRTRHEI